MVNGAAVAETDARPARYGQAAEGPHHVREAASLQVSVRLVALYGAVRKFSAPATVYIEDESAARPARDRGGGEVGTVCCARSDRRRVAERTARRPPFKEPRET